MDRIHCRVANAVNAAVAALENGIVASKCSVFRFLFAGLCWVDESRFRYSGEFGDDFEGGGGSHFFMHQRSSTNCTILTLETVKNNMIGRGLVFSLYRMFSRCLSFSFLLL